MRDIVKNIRRGGETENCTKDWMDKTGWISQGTGDL